MTYKVYLHCIPRALRGDFLWKRYNWSRIQPLSFFAPKGAKKLLSLHRGAKKRSRNRRGAAALAVNICKLSSDFVGFA